MRTTRLYARAFARGARLFAAALADPTDLRPGWRADGPSVIENVITDGGVLVRGRAAAIRGCDFGTGAVDDRAVVELHQHPEPTP